MQKQRFYIYLHHPDRRKYPSEELAKSDKQRRQAWEILVNYFGRKCDTFRTYYDPNSGMDKEVEPIKSYIEKFEPSPEFANWAMRGDGNITKQFLLDIIKAPYADDIISGPVSPVFDFKFYKNDEEIFVSSDYGDDVLFLINEKEKKEIESLLNKEEIYFELEAQRMI